MFVDGQFTLLFIYTSEQFPTYIRSTCLGIANAFGKIGPILAINLTINADNSFFVIILILTGALSILIAPFIVFLEETHHKELDEMIENNNREPFLVRN